MSDPNDSISIKFKTDELGAFKKALNLDELLLFYKNKFDKIIAKTTSPELKKKFNDLNFIKQNSYKYLLNFYTFHGAKYDLKKDYKGKMKTGNNYGGAPFDTDVNVWLDEIDSENNNFIMRSYQKLDSIQLKKAISKFLKLSEDNVPEITHETYIANRIHGTGWTTYSILTKEVKSENSKNVEEFILNMK